MKKEIAEKDSEYSFLQQIWNIYTHARQTLYYHEQMSRKTLSLIMGRNMKHNIQEND